MMKNFLLLFYMVIGFISCNSKDKRPLLGETEYQQKLNITYKDASKSPLKTKDLKGFKGLDFFSVDTTFIITATFTKTDNATIFKMPTNTERRPLYKEYGIANFILKGKKCQLTIYQSQDDVNNEAYKNVLFLPFTDATSGNESYGAGRYMDLLTTDITNNTVVLNFNNTYNPYCAYNDKYSCPLTPRQNHLEIAVKAGVKAFKKH